MNSPLPLDELYDDDIFDDDDFGDEDDLLGLDDEDDMLGLDDDDDFGDDDFDDFGDDDDLFQNMMHEADSGPEGYSTVALSYMTPAEAENDLLSPYALRALNPMNAYPGVTYGDGTHAMDDDDTDEFGADMEMDEAEEFGVLGLATLAAVATVFPVASASLAAGGAGVAGLVANLRGNPRKYARIAARLARLAEKDKMSSPRWARNAGRLRAVWRKMEKRGKTTGLQSPTQILNDLRGGSSSPALQKARAIAARSPQSSSRVNPQQRKAMMDRRRAKMRARMRRRAAMQQQVPQSAQSVATSSRRGIRPHQARQMQQDIHSSNFARRRSVGPMRRPVRARMGPPPAAAAATYTPTSIRVPGSGQGGFGSFNTGQYTVPEGYRLTPDFGTVFKAHPIKSILLGGLVFAGGVMLAQPTKRLYSGISDRIRG